MDIPTPTQEQCAPDIESRITDLQRNIIEINNKLTYVMEESRKAARARAIAFWLTVIFFLLPLVGIMLMIPTLMGQLNSVMSVTM